MLQFLSINRHTIAGGIALSYEKHLTVFWQGPHLIVYLCFELVDVVAYLLHERLYGVVISNGFLTLRLYLVGYLTGIGKGLAAFLDVLHAHRDFRDERKVGGCNGLELLLRKDTFQGNSG